MALQNRTELLATIAGLAAVVDLIELQAVLDDLVESLSSQKPVSNSVTLTTASETISFTGYDYVLATTTASTSDVDITGVQVGETKWLKVDNSALASWQFITITNDIAFPTNITTDAESFYKVWNIDGTIHVKNLSNDISVASNAAALIGAATTSLISAANLKYVVRSGHKILSNAETYVVADGIGAIEVPAGVSGGSITLTDASAATSTGQVVEIASSGGSGVTIYLEGDADTSVSVGKVYRYRSNGSNWYATYNY